MRLLHIALVLLVATGCSKRPDEAKRDPKLENKVSNRTVTLYFESPELLLTPEQRTLALPERDAAAISPVVSEVIKGSANASVPRLFPADANVRGAFLLPDGTAIVDLGGPSLTNGWSTGSHAEVMALYSVVHTLTANFPAVRRVRFLVNGQAVETLAGHVRIDRSLRPLPSLVGPGQTTSQAAPAAR